MNILEDDWSLSHWKGATDKEHNITNLPTKIITSNGAIIAELRWDNLKNVTALDAYKIGKLMVKANKMRKILKDLFDAQGMHAYINPWLEATENILRETE